MREHPQAKEAVNRVSESRLLAQVLEALRMQVGNRDEERRQRFETMFPQVIDIVARRIIQEDRRVFQEDQRPGNQTAVLHPSDPLERVVDHPVSPESKATSGTNHVDANDKGKSDKDEQEGDRKV